MTDGREYNYNLCSDSSDWHRLAHEACRLRRSTPDYMYHQKGRHPEHNDLPQNIVVLLTKKTEAHGHFHSQRSTDLTETRDFLRS